MHAPVSAKRKKIALFIAGLSDLVQVVFFPAFVEGAASPFDIGLDVATAIVLLLILGFKWRLAIAFAIELAPGADLFPTWTALVMSLPSEKAPPALAPHPTTDTPQPPVADTRQG